MTDHDPISWAQYVHQRNTEQARILAEALLGHPIQDTPAYYDTLEPKANRSTRNHRHLLVALLKQRDGNQCYLCSKTLEPSHTDIDHIIPIAHGGEDEPWNVALACSPCNTRKAACFVSFDVPSGRAVYHLM